MRYEVYGIYNDSGTNYGPIVVAQSMRCAIKQAKEVVSLNCKYWAVLEKQRKNSYPYSIVSGLRGQDATRATMLFMPNPKYGNPITSSDDGAKYWTPTK